MTTAPVRPVLRMPRLADVLPHLTAAYDRYRWDNPALLAECSRCHAPLYAEICVPAGAVTICVNCGPDPRLPETRATAQPRGSATP